MKKFSISLFLFLSIIAKVHTNELKETETFTASNGFKLDLVTDLMTEKVTLSVQNYLWATNDRRTKGAVIVPTFSFTSNQWKYSSLVVQMAVGNCHENDSLLFLLENNSRFTTYQFGDFTCDEVIYFDLYGQVWSQLETIAIKAIRAVNARSGENYTFVAEQDKDKNYFLMARQALKEYNDSIKKPSLPEAMF